MNPLNLWGFFSIKIKEKIYIFEILFPKVLTYIRSPYGYVNNTNAVDSGIIKVVITDKKGNKTNLNDMDDPVDMTVDMSEVGRKYISMSLKLINNVLLLIFITRVENPTFI